MLIVSAQTQVCALPLTLIIETMRALPIELVPRTPHFVRGISIIRGIPTPVVDLGLLLGTPGGVANRFVTLRLGNRRVALSVDAVLGIKDFDAMKLHALPPLLAELSKDMVEAIGTRDAQLLLVMRSGWELPDDVWQGLLMSKASQ
jgi:purine-binding chemotaxis protein CheW